MPDRVPARTTFDPACTPVDSRRDPVRASRLLTLAVCAVSMAALAGCATNYRPVVTAINPSGPAQQPTKYAAVISGRGTAAAPANGLFSLVDFSGDTILNTTTIGSNPIYFNTNSTGSVGYVINADGTLNSFALSSSLIASNINTTTLPANANPFSLFPANNNVYVAEAGLNEIGVLGGSLANPAFLENLPTGTAGGAMYPSTRTVYTIGTTLGTNANAPRLYTLVQNTAGGNGYAAAIETSTNTISAALPVGVNPVYGVLTADYRRAFVLNNGSASVSVINSQTNALDTFNSPTNPAQATSTIPVGVAPVWADFAPPLSELVVVNQGNGSTPGSVSIISIPLCTTTSINNPNCDSANPVDAVGFGTIIATIPVGVNPVMVACLQDGTQCYVANQGNGANNIAGSVSVINLQTNTVVATIPAAYQNTLPTDATIHGYPTYIAATTGTPTGKVYVISGAAPSAVASPNTLTYASTDLTVLRTDTNRVQLYLPLQGYGISVRVSNP